MLLMYTVYVINMKKNLALASMWVPTDTHKTENPDISQQNLQAQTVFPLKKRVKRTPSPKSPRIVIKELSERRKSKLFSRYP